MIYKPGRQIVTTIGTAVQLATDDTVWDSIVVQALYANTGYVVVFPFSGIRARDGEQNGLLFKGGTTLERKAFSGVRLSELWMDATVANDGVAFECQRNG